MIATDVGAISEIIDDGITGFVISVGDAAALAHRIQRLLDDPVLAAEMGRLGPPEGAAAIRCGEQRAAATLHDEGDGG